MEGQDRGLWNLTVWVQMPHLLLVGGGALGELLNASAKAWCGMKYKRVNYTAWPPALGNLV